MSDCADLEIREMLPEYLHGALQPAERARVASHLSSCAECAAELRLLETVRRSHQAAAPAVNVAAIARALPSPRRVSPRREWMLRIAAVISFVSIGGVSLVVAKPYLGREVSAMSSRESARADARDRSAKLLATESAAATAPGRHAVGLTTAGGVGDLDSDELELLIGALDRLDASPAAEPDDRIGTAPPSGVTR